MEIKRRKRRKYHNWEKEIIKGNTDAFYHSTEWKILREEALKRDRYKCQFFLGRWNDGIHFPATIKLIDANTVHHKKSIKERPDLCLDIDNLVSLSFEAHEIIEDRVRFRFKDKKKVINEEKW